MVISCFRSPRDTPTAGVEDDRPQASRPTIASHARKSSRFLRRSNTDGSRMSGASSTSNESISKLPPCKRESDAKIEAMMMPLPDGHRPSKCMRLSFPKTYSNLVTDMKAAKGCRDWRNFAVFPNDDIDMTVSADAYARKRASEFERNIQKLNDSFQWSEGSSRSTGIECADLIA